MLMVQDHLEVIFRTERRISLKEKSRKLVEYNKQRKILRSLKGYIPES